MMTTAHEVRNVFTQHPDLGLFGFGTQPPAPDSDFLDQVATARKWLTGAPECSRILAHRSSYAVKHMIEKAAGRYISNGAAIAGALLEGFAPVRKNPGPNCYFHRQEQHHGNDQ
ncbi:hypothetical protein [Noviherbaspirillum sedimenti]|uniref:Uncharacterized protein n=1 Tax=Noviherbaspirillum sedimenti TaxID=2320865 RepID=A0A3A3GDM6_9BURK|nr:hypothetical protein [Noviherbaspirillum sedimenti]RJG00336.1 hypothetical protein D3878_01055 [Noviherbaspirillum sedimenti]